MATDTSIQAYHKAVASGLISGRRNQVFRAMFDLAPVFTQQDVINQFPTITQSSIQPRVRELELHGVIEQVEKVDGPYAKVQAYRLTGRDPQPLPKVKSITRRDIEHYYLGLTSDEKDEFVDWFNNLVTQEVKGD